MFGIWRFQTIAILRKKSVVFSCKVMQSRTKWELNLPFGPCIPVIICTLLHQVRRPEEPRQPSLQSNTAAPFINTKWKWCIKQFISNLVFFCAITKQYCAPSTCTHAILCFLCISYHVVCCYMWEMKHYQLVCDVIPSFKFQLPR